MASKLTANGVYEGSRIILPEHREAYQECRSITLTVFNPFDDEELRGVVTSIDKPNRRIKLVRGDEDYSWPKIEEIIKASL
ncbi:YolD-like family protein [Paenibacillus sp. LK1]|uniref:YolD-like family protein n=1 Tax=Paenibacillus sp. LK1 TaxID=2053014 RepID=UPI000C192DB7|nr:YolD-like family protein [Paenibacillus sp. LK1]PIH60403.1 hypothetical protein CS562_04705 [Paenibacillus sp. LK1]